MQFGRTITRLLLICSLLVLSSLAMRTVTDQRTVASATIADSDWPQLSRDAQRSSASPQAVNGPYRYYWRWTDVPIASRVQPVVASGRLFIGGLNGVFYALDAAYDAAGGAPPILWQQDLHSPIRSGAAVDGMTVVVGTHHGAIYGLDASTGQQLWSVSTAGAILAAPLIYSGVAYLGSASGSFYAIRTGDGAVLWQQAIGPPILGSAALSTDGTELFFVAENVVAYSLATSNGAILWQTQLQGQSAADRWPVVLGSTVFFRTMPIRFFPDILHSGDAAMDSAGALLSNWGADWALIKPAIIQYLNNNPADQTFFALNASNGQSQGLAPMLYTFGNNDAPSPPTAFNQALYLPYRPRHGIQNDSPVAVHVTTRYDAELGRMDPISLDVTGLTTPDTFNYQFRLTSDEPAVLTVAGNLLLVDNWERLGGINLSDGSLVGIAQEAYNSPCYGDWAANSNLAPFYDNCPFPGPNVGEGRARTGAAVASGRIFWRAWERGLAAIGPINGSTSVPLPAATPSPTPGPLPTYTLTSTQALQGYVWTEPQRPVPTPAAELTQKLEQEVSRIVATNDHLMPFYLERGMRGPGSWPPDVSNSTPPAVVEFSKAFWYDPGELLVTLSMAYPYLNPTLQGQLRTYLQGEMTRFPPLKNLTYPATSWLTMGQAREPYPVLIRNSSWYAWPPPGTPIQTIYALWAYGRYTGDWAYVSAQWSQIQSLFYAKSVSINSYAQIAGAIGYARIAKQLGYTSEASAGESAAVAAMQAGYNFGQWRDIANSLYGAPPERPNEEPGLRGPVFFGLTTEVGNYLRDTNLAAVESTIDHLTGYPDGSYLWYATHLGTQLETGETSYRSPEIAWSIFLAEAYVNHVSQPQLRYWLDRPWGLGDVWYLQKLIATIEAPPAPHSSSLSPILK